MNGHLAYDLGETDAKRFAPVFNRIEHLMARAPEILGTHYEIAYPGRQLKTARDLRLLPLDKEYRAAKAHLGQFYGWERPLYFGKEQEPVMTFGKPDWFDNVAREVDAAHNHAAIFDASCFGKIEVTGPDAEKFLQYTCAGNMAKAAGSVIYTAVLNARGTFESDITAQRLTDDHYRLFVGTNAIKRDLAWFERHSESFDVNLKDTTEDYATLGLMGPDAARIASAFGADALNDLGYFKLGKATMAGVEVLGARLSYVGEAGWELTCKTKDVNALYAAMTKAGATPAGLFAQTAMRVEKGFCAMGHELDSDVTPIDVGLDFAVKKKADFIGKSALNAKRDVGIKNGVMTLVLDDETAVPLGHEPIYLDGAIIGETTTAAFGYRIGKPIALAHIKGLFADGQKVELDIARQMFSGRLLNGPAFDPKGERMRS